MLAEAETVPLYLPLTDEGHFRIHVYAVIARIIARLQSLKASTPGYKSLDEFPFLTGYQLALKAFEPPDLSLEEEVEWWDSQILEFEEASKSSSSFLPLVGLKETVGLSDIVVKILVAVGLVEEDIRFGSLFSALQDPIGARRPCIGVISWLLSDYNSGPADLWSECRLLLETGFLNADNRNEARSEWLLKVPTPIWDALRGKPFSQPAPGLIWQLQTSFPELDQLVLPKELYNRIKHLPDLLTKKQVQTLIIRGMNGSGRRTVLGAVARALNKGIILWEGGSANDDTWKLLGPLATLMNAVPVLRYNPGPGETLELPVLPGYAGVVGITLGRSGGLRGSLVQKSLSLNIPTPGYSERKRFWEAAQTPILEADSEEIVERFLLTGGLIHQVAGLGQAYASLEGRDTVSTVDIQQASRMLNRQLLETLATPLETGSNWSGLIVGATTDYELKALEARCRARETLQGLAGAAFESNLNRGVRAMFTGPSGTGKTLAARTLAGALQMDLYRVDLAAVVNKYIGETERNLNQVLSRAEELDVVLLLDEGDALMTSRTEVKNANDRYANLETNYLLQRLENYEGIVFITTNAGNRIDPAFLRRLDVIIEFTPPEANERLLIWQSHLASPNTISSGFLEEVAGRCVLTGGQIRNAALYTSMLALSNKCVPGDSELEVAVQREYRKAGAAYPMRLKTEVAGQIKQLHRFITELS